MWSVVGLMLLVWCFLQFPMMVLCPLEMPSVGLFETTEVTAVWTNYLVSIAAFSVMISVEIDCQTFVREKECSSCLPLFWFPWLALSWIGHLSLSFRKRIVWRKDWQQAFEDNLDVRFCKCPRRTLIQWQHQFPLYSDDYHQRMMLWSWFLQHGSDE
jgi:hypothetical protein